MYGRLDEALDRVASRDSSLNLPSVSGSDNGKLLTVSSGNWTAVADRLPTVSGSDNGKALIVSGGAWTAAAIPSQLPAVTSADEGKVLAVNSSGQWVAVTLT